MIYVRKLKHNGEIIIGLHFHGHPQLLKSVKSIQTLRYSKTFGTWYLPYRSDSWRAFLALNIAYTIDTVGTTDHAPSLSDNADENIAVPPEACNKQAADNQIVSIRYMHPYFYVRNVNQGQVEAIKKIPKAYWNGRYSNWVVPADEQALAVFHDQLGIISTEIYQNWIAQIQNVINPPVCTLYTSPEYSNKVLVELKGKGIDVEYMKHVSERRYENERQFWIIPNDRKIIERIEDHYISKRTKVINRIKLDYVAPRIPSYGALYDHLMKKCPHHLKEKIESYLKVLITERYSQKTIKEYHGKFLSFASKMYPKDITELTVKEVNNFLCEISKEKVSESLIHSYINAIKFYYKKVILLPEFNLEQIKRPRNHDYLPKVLSIEQVDAVLRATSNLKHTTILYGFYGHGVRLAELLALKLDDILWDRNQLFVEGGKGKKDRYVPLSQEFKEMLKLYIHEYKPIYYVFEGQDRKSQYTDRSTQQVVSKAAKKCGIRRRVTPHMLRHSYATHLMDGGTQIPFIKEILGHSDIKTTMIYTHITTASIDKIVSPLDRLRGKR